MLRESFGHLGSARVGVAFVLLSWRILHVYGIVRVRYTGYGLGGTSKGGSYLFFSH